MGRRGLLMSSLYPAVGWQNGSICLKTRYLSCYSKYIEKTNGPPARPSVFRAVAAEELGRKATRVIGGPAELAPTVFQRLKTIYEKTKN